MNQRVRALLRARPRNDWVAAGIPITILFLGRLLAVLAFARDRHYATWLWAVYIVMSVTGVALLVIGFTRPARASARSAPR